jgi:hypothetical protein
VANCTYTIGWQLETWSNEGGLAICGKNGANKSLIIKHTGPVEDLLEVIKICLQMLKPPLEEL